MRAVTIPRHPSFPVFVLIQLIASNRQARARFLVDVINRYFDDPAISDLHYKVDNNTYTFNDESPESWRKTTEPISRTMYYLDTVGFLVDTKVITLKDIAVLKHRILSFFANGEVQEAFTAMYGQDGVKDAHEPAAKLEKLLSKS